MGMIVREVQMVLVLSQIGVGIHLTSSHLTTGFVRHRLLGTPQFCILRLIRSHARSPYHGTALWSVEVGMIPLSLNFTRKSGIVMNGNLHTEKTLAESGVRRLRAANRREGP